MQSCCFVKICGKWTWAWFVSGPQMFVWLLALGWLSGPLELVGLSGRSPLQILADQLTLFQSGGRLCPPNYCSPFPRIFSPSYGSDVNLLLDDEGWPYIWNSTHSSAKAKACFSGQKSAEKTEIHIASPMQYSPGSFNQMHARDDIHCNSERQYSAVGRSENMGGMVVL